MKPLLTLLVMLALSTSAFADRFICLWLNQSASAGDKVKVRNGINALFSEPKQDNYINVDLLPVAYVIASPNVKGWFLVISEAQLDNLGVPTNRRAVTFLNNWKNENMANPNHLRWARGDSWEQVLMDNGLALVETEGGGL